MVTIDKQSGFCFGVVTAIRKAEEELSKSETLYCLGEIVHNNQEVERLANAGLKTINHEEFSRLPKGAKVLIRAHGEPPQTYQTAKEKGILLIDASCPVVRHLQQKIRTEFTSHPDAQIVILGKRGHAEVVGLQGQTDNTAIVVENSSDLEKIDYKKNIYLFSQTTKSTEEFQQIVSKIQEHINEAQQDNHLPDFQWYDTICGQVRNRVKHIREFAASQDKVLFVGGRNSSNGKVLYEHCKEANEDTIFIESANELSKEYIDSCKGKNIGICGATSTPLWLMEEVANEIRNRI